MKVKLISEGTKGELMLEGRLDAKTSPDVEEVFNQMVDRFDDVVLNMADLNYVTSAGLRAIKKIHIGMKKKGGTLVLTNVNKMVMEVFEVTGFAGLLHFE